MTEPTLPAAVALVAAGGFAGGLARYAADLAAPSTATGFPWSTFAVNTVGALALGVLVVVLRGRPRSAYLRPLLATGLLGAFTTFSAVAAHAVRLWTSGYAGTAAAFVGLSTLAGLAAAAAGLAAATTARRRAA